MTSEEPSKPAGRRWRRIVALAGVIVAVLATTLAAALLIRENLAQVVLQNRLTGLGLAEPRFRVDHFTTKALSIAGFSAGSALSFDRLTVGYSIDDLLDGRVARIDLIGLRADMTQSGPWTDFRSKRPSGTGPSLDPSTLPIINVQQARLRIPVPDGAIDVTANTVLKPARNGTMSVSATASAAGSPGKIDMGYDGTIRVGADGATNATGRFRTSSTALAVGKMVIKSMKADLPLSVDATAAGVTVLVQKGARFEAKRVDLKTGHGTGPIGATLTGRLTSPRSSDGLFDATADIVMDARKIRAGNLAADRFSATLPLRIKAGPGTATINIAADGRLSLDGAQTTRNGPDIKLSTLLSGNVSLTWPENSSDKSTGTAIGHALSITPAPITLSGAPEISATLGRIDASGTLDAKGAYKGSVAIDSGLLTRGSQAVAMTGLTARLTSDAGLAKPNLLLTLDTIRDVSVATIAGAPVAGTYDLAATIHQTGDGITYRIDVGGLGIKKLAAINGLHDFNRRAGHADVSLPVLSLGASGVQPSSVIPALGTIRNVAGSIGGDAKLIWDAEKIGGQATLRLDGIGGATEAAVIEGLGGTLVLNNLWPPATAPGQILRIAKIDAGAVLTDTSIRFALLPSGTLRIGRAEARLADGKIIIVAPAIDPVAQSAKARVTFQGIQLEQILNLVDLGDLKATGQIHGSVPVRIAHGKIAIEAGALASLGGGKLQFKSERAKQILKSGGDQVGLMLQALEDFTYERLGVDIDKSMAGNARVTLRTLGHNPAVLRGRKFQINVNLETNLDRLLDATLEWYRLSGRALRDIVTPRARKGTQ